MAVADSDCGSGSRRCGCRGVRTCLFCEDQNGTTRSTPPPSREEVSHVIHQCHKCGRVFPEVGGGVQPDTEAPPLFRCAEPCSTRRVLRALHSQGESCDSGPIRFEGVTLIKEFVSAEEECSIVRAIDGWKWAESQSGRRKQVCIYTQSHPILHLSMFSPLQDFGPKVNFKKQKLKLGAFSGLPSFSQPLVERIQRDSQLTDFVPVELCNLEYCPERGSAIVPHRDDSWLWGERLVTLTLLSHTILSFSPSMSPTSLEVRVPLPRRSLVVVRGQARHSWLHAIHRDHILSRRLGVTLRELSDEFLTGGQREDEGRTLWELAGTFNGLPSNSGENQSN